MKEDRFEGWCRNTHMEFTVINHRDPTHNVVKGEARLTVMTAGTEHCWLTKLASGALVHTGPGSTAGSHRGATQRRQVTLPLRCRFEHQVARPTNC